MAGRPAGWGSGARWSSSNDSKKVPEVGQFEARSQPFVVQDHRQREEGAVHGQIPSQTAIMGRAGQAQGAGVRLEGLGAGS